MKHGRLIAVAGAAIIASASPLLAGAPAASAAVVPAAVVPAAVVPAATSSPVITVNLGSCTFRVTVNEDRDSNGAYVDAYLNTDPCGIGIEGAIWGPDFTPASYGGDVHSAGDNSVTGYLPINSGNHHGIRFFYNDTWNYAPAD